MTDAIVERLRALFVESLHIEVPSADTDLFETGMLDSLQLVELLIKIDDIELDDLRSLARIAGLLAAHIGAADASSARPSYRASERDASAAKG